MGIYAYIGAAVVGLAAGNEASRQNAPDIPDAPPPPRATPARPQQADTRARQRARGSTTRSDTILTGPLGLTGQEDTAQAKTLLGR